MKVVGSSQIETRGNHREDFETCPHCEKKTPNKQWDKAATIIVLSPTYQKKGCVAIISECPHCDQLSWVHNRMDYFSDWSDWPENVKKAVQRLHEAVKLEALRTWANALCGHCKNLKDGTVNEGTYRTCTIGMGPAVEECKHFKPL